MRRRPDNVPTDNDVKQENIPENEIVNNISENQNVPEDNHDTEAQTEEVTTEPVGIAVGSRVKIKPDVGNDILGRRIHNGIKNYVYTVKTVRVDGYYTVECMTYQFTLAEKDLDLQ